ncbi:alpha/beta hydrolase [Endothiovibrio diazotrophicus]
MTEPLLPCIEIEPPSAADAAVIWLHGLGADGHDFAGIVPQLRLPPTAAIRFLFPHAPEMPVTLNNGYVMRAWYDLYSLDLSGGEDEAGIRASAARLEALVAREVARGVAEERVVLAGFSQGGAVALHAGLRHPARLGGVMALSTYLPLRAKAVQERREEGQETPCFVAHGEFDPVIPPQAGRHTAEQLEGWGMGCEFHEYPMDHSVHPQEIEHIRAWLLRVLDLAADE